MTLALGLGKVALASGVAHAYVPAILLGAEKLSAQLAGHFDTQWQFDHADPALKVPPKAEGKWLDRQYAIMQPVDAPLVGRRVLYLEWHSGGPGGPISRQRIWAFEDDGSLVRMRFYTIRDTKRLVGQHADSLAFRSLSMEDLTGYPKACDAMFEPHWWGNGFTGRIDPEQCRIVAASGREMRLDVTIHVEPEGWVYSEKGILSDGNIAFAVPPTEPYQFARLVQSD